VAGVRRGLGLAILLMLASPWGSAAVAQPAGLEPGVHVDPHSPAAKEYALPLAQARKTGGGGSQGARALFGAGIHRRAQVSEKGPRGITRGAERRAGHRVPDQPSNEAATPASATLAGARKQADGTSSGDSLLALLGGGVAVLVVGALAGTILRRRPVRPRR
jgi:hypothetical protein